MTEEPKHFDGKLALPLFVTISLAFSGYYYTYQKDLHLAERKDRLERVNLLFPERRSASMLRRTIVC